MKNPHQLPLFWLCDVCGHPHGVPLRHHACGVAMERWFRKDNLDTWADQPSRAIL